MGFFSKVANALNEAAAESARKKEEKDRQEQALLNDYRSRGIYVLAVYVDGILWNYFHYPSEDHRIEAAKKFWPPFFNNLNLSFRIEYINPR